MRVFFCFCFFSGCVWKPQHLSHIFVLLVNSQVLSFFVHHSVTKMFDRKNIMHRSVTERFAVTP